MAEARDRRTTAEDIAEAYMRRRRSLVGSPDSTPSVDEVHVEVDQPGEATTPRTGFVRGISSRVMRRVTGGGVFGSPRYIRSRGFRGIENVVPGGSRGRARGRVLPSWYPRRPLQDITAVVREIGRKRARGEDEGQSSLSLIPASTAHFEHDTSMLTQRASSSKKPFSVTPFKVPKILLDITNENKDDSECLTPQKKLLNSIDSVEKQVMEEIEQQKRTPTARKAERKKKVRTLMSMR